MDILRRRRQGNVGCRLCASVWKGRQLAPPNVAPDGKEKRPDASFAHSDLRFDCRGRLLCRIPNLRHGGRPHIGRNLQKDLDNDLKPYGINLAFVSITNISFGPQYQQASEARAAAEQEYQKELTVLKTKKVIAQQNEAIAEGQAGANAKLRIIAGRSQFR